MGHRDGHRAGDTMARSLLGPITVGRFPWVASIGRFRQLSVLS